MKVTVLGCGGSAGVPMIGGSEGEITGIWGKCDPADPRNRRSRSSVVLEKEGFRLLIDSGPDFRSQMLACRFSCIDAVIYTHGHSDHVAGLDELRAVNRVIKRAIPLYADENTLREIKIRFAYAFGAPAGRGFPLPVFETHILGDGRMEEIGPFRVRTFPQRHGRQESRGIRADNFGYCTDVSAFPEDSLARLRGVDTWMVGCFQPDFHPAHACLEQALEWRTRIQARRTILTHMGPAMDYQTISALLPQDVTLAFDGRIFEVPQDSFQNV